MNDSTIVAYAPGRVELLGNHTDYNGGVVLAAAIDRGLTVTGSVRSDSRIVLRSRAIKGVVEVSASNIWPQVDQPWANYPLGVVQQFLDAGMRVSGFEMMVDGNLPSGGGLSSSAAFEVATGCFLLKAFGLQLPRMQLAKLCQRAENNFVGVKSGLLDQATSVFGKRDHAVYLDCRTEEVQTIPFPSDLALVLADSGVKHSLVAGEYNERRAQCFAVAKALGVPALRDVTSEQLDAHAGSLTPAEYRRAKHVVGEDERVWKAVDLLSAGDGPGFGELMNRSHESSRVNFENSTPELDLLVEIARSLPGVLGARLTGGGFGGGTVTLAKADQAEAVARELNQRYAGQTGWNAGAFVCRIADGAIPE